MNPQTGVSVTFDNLPIWLALVCAAAACAAYLIVWLVRRDEGPSPIRSAARVLYYVSFGATAAAALYLMQSILSGNRFDIAYVYENTSVGDPLIYRISSFWAGQQGSLLLWALLGGLVGLPLLKRLDKSSPLLMCFWCSVQSFLLVLLVVDDPMRRVVDLQPGTMGLGLNPLLKSPWMVPHPPVVFLAYALLCVPAAFAVQAIVEGEFTRWARSCLPWALIGWTAMTAGLVLGMIWSYEVLGWGGYWAWDPIENASLVPWLLCTALVHGLVFQRERGRNARWNVVLALATFVSVMYAMYLTRSGIAADVSVHSFGDTKSYLTMPIYQWLKWVPIGYAALCFGLLVARFGVLPREKKALETDSRDFALAIGLIVVCLLALVVLVGTTYATFNPKADVEPSFYTRVSIPLALAVLLLTALSPLLKWGGEKGQWKENLALWSGLAALAIGVGIAIVVGIISLASTKASAVLFGWLLPDGQMQSRIAPFVMALMLVVSIVAVLASWIPLTRSSLNRCGAYLAHAGVALMIIGMILSSAGRSKVLDLELGGGPGRAFGYSFTYKGTRPEADDKERILVTASRGGRRFDVPLSYLRMGRETLFYPHARTTFLSDLYVSPEKMIADTITPTMLWGGSKWVSNPIDIPGAAASLALVGMQVDSKEATLLYAKPGARPVQFVVTRKRPAKVDGYTFVFKDFTSSGEHNVMPHVAGVVIGIRGRGFGESAVIRVSTKPLINLLWIGTLLIFAGGALAWDRRREEKAA